MARRHSRKLTFRPPLPRCAIVWFPPFPADSAIEPFRAANDPAAANMPAHVMLVFPFHTVLTPLQIASHVKKIVGNWPPLPISIRDIEGLLDTFVLLMVRDRAEALTQLHDKLYTGVLAPFLRDDIVFQPHITVGRVPYRTDPTAAEHDPAFDAMLSAASVQIRGEWQFVLRELAVITLPETGAIKVDHLVPLNFL